MPTSGSDIHSRLRMRNTSTEWAKLGSASFQKPPETRMPPKNTAVATAPASASMTARTVMLSTSQYAGGTACPEVSASASAPSTAPAAGKSSHNVPNAARISPPSAARRPRNGLRGANFDGTIRLIASIGVCHGNRQVADRSPTPIFSVRSTLRFTSPSSRHANTTLPSESTPRAERARPRLAPIPINTTPAIAKFSNPL